MQYEKRMKRVWDKTYPLGIDISRIRVGQAWCNTLFFYKKTRLIFAQNLRTN